MTLPLRMHETSLALAGLLLLGSAAGAAAGGSHGGHGGHGGHSGANGGHSGFVSPGGGRGQGGGVLVPNANPGHVHGGGQGRGGHGGHGGHGHGGHGHGVHPGWIAGGAWYVAPAPIYGYGYGSTGVYGYGYAPGVVADQPPAGAVSYCPSLQAYYPDVSDCPGGWLLVVPAPGSY